MTIVRPVLSTLPENASTLDKSFGHALPLSYVVLPFGYENDNVEEEETRMINHYDDYNTIHKCSNCGAIHNKCSIRNKRYDKDNDLYTCPICMNTYLAPRKRQPRPQRYYKNNDRNDRQPSKQTISSNNSPFVDYATASSTYRSDIDDDDDDEMLWTWSLLLDGTCTCPKYWNGMSMALSQLIHNDNGPKMAIWIMTGDGGVSLWSANGSHTVHYHDMNTLLDSLEDDDARRRLFVERWYHSTLDQSLFRTLKDPATWKHLLSLYNNHKVPEKKGLHMMETIETILSILPTSNNNNTKNTYSSSNSSDQVVEDAHSIWLFPSTSSYQPSLPLRHSMNHTFFDTSLEEEQPTTGYASYYGEDQLQQQQQQQEQEDDDYSSSSSSSSSYSSFDDGDPASLLLHNNEHNGFDIHYLEKMYNLGLDCIQSHVSIQCTFIHTNNKNYHNHNHSINNNSRNEEEDAHNLGLPYYEILCEDTGGQLQMFPNTNSNNNNNNTTYSNSSYCDSSGDGQHVWARSLTSYLQKQLMDMRFLNVKMRILCSPSLKFIPVNNPTLNTSTNSNNNNNILEKNVMYLGHCCPYTTCALDFNTNSYSLHAINTYDSTNVNPCLQIQIAYTVLQKIHEQTTSATTWKAVRKIRVWTKALNTTRSFFLPRSLGCTTEAVLNGMDMEALAVILFHHFHNTGHNEGWSMIRSAAQDWLVTILLATYRSAEYFNDFSNKQQHMLVDQKYVGKFYPQDRLLQSRGTSNTWTQQKQVLLANGHDVLHSLPLLVFSLLQNKAFQGNVESSWVEISKFKTMPPSALSRCLAPRLELWSSNGELLERHLPLHLSNLISKLEPYNITTTDDNDSSFLLLLDSPQQIMVLASPSQLLCTPPSLVHEEDYNHHNPKEQSLKIPIVLPKELKIAVNEASKSYSVPPPINYYLNPAEDCKEGIQLLKRAMIQDKKLLRRKDTHRDGRSKQSISYNQWCTHIARRVLSHLKDEG